MIGRGVAITIGTIVCDLERRHPVTLLPDREPTTAPLG
jgi:hypothetical protein